MKKLKLKPYVKKTIIVMSVVLCMIITYSLFSIKTQEVSGDYTFVNDNIFDKYYPVIKEEEKIFFPYLSQNVKIYKNFYDKDSSKDEQENGIIYHEGTYMQNSGVSFTSDEQFDIQAIISGTVTNVSDDSLLGKSIEIRSSNEIIVMYQSLSTINVKVGDLITQGQIIGKSGSCKLYSDIENIIHIEIYKNGMVINPQKYFNKSLKELMDE